MHDRQQHVGIDSEISVIRNLHKFHRDSFLGRRGWFNNVRFCFLLTLFKFSTFLLLTTVGNCCSYFKRSKYKQTTLYSSYCKHGCDNSLPVLVAKPLLWHTVSFMEISRNLAPLVLKLCRYGYAKICQHQRWSKVLYYCAARAPFSSVLFTG